MLTVQPFTPDYQQSVIDLILSVQHEFGIPIYLVDQPDLLNIPQVYQINRGNFWIALAGDQPVGTIALIDIGNRQAVIRKMFVLPAYRGKTIGAGQLLLQTLLNWSVSQQIQTLLLGTTEKFKAAHRFYEKNGFVSIAKTELPASFPLMEVDTRFYRLQIDPNYSALR